MGGGGCHDEKPNCAGADVNFTNVSRAKREELLSVCDVTKGANTVLTLVTPHFVCVGSASCIHRTRFSFKLCQKNLRLYQKAVNRGLTKLLFFSLEPFRSVKLLHREGGGGGAGGCS